jgi:4-amino-4-deoxy-L-arabinose transferase-like glycosyltransferase
MSASPRSSRLRMSFMVGRVWRGRSSRALGVFWILVILVGFCVLGNIFWLRRHSLTIPPPWDQAFYLYMGIRYLWALTDYGLGALISEFIKLSPDVAPLFPLTSLPLYVLFGPSRLVAYMTNAVYLLGLLWGVYLLGAHIYSRRAVILAAFTLATFTATVNYSRDYLLEFPATLFVTLAIYALVRSGEFQHRLWCLVFGTLAGFSVLTKTMTGIFFVGPVLHALGCLIKQRQLTPALLRNSLLVVAMAILVASIWWGPNFRTSFGYLIYYGFQAGSVPYSKDGVGILSLENLSYYALALMNHGTSFFYASLFGALRLVSGVQHVFGMQRSDAGRREGGGKEGILWAWLLVGYAVLTIVPNKGEERYAQPLLPPIALLLAGSVEAIGRRWMRRGVVVVIVAIGGFNYVGLTYGLPWLPQRLYLHSFAIISHEYPHFQWLRSKIPPTPDVEGRISAILSVLAALHDQHRGRVETELRTRLLDPMQVQAIGEDMRMTYRFLLAREPKPRELQKYIDPLRGRKLTLEELIEILKASKEFKAQRAWVLVVPDHPQFNASTLRYYGEVDRLPLRFTHIVDGPITPERLQRYEFILTKRNGYQGPEFSTRLTDEIHALLRQRDSGFVPLPESFEFPDTSQIVIYTAQVVLN